MFEDDPNTEQGMTFCTHALNNGVYLQVLARDVPAP